MWQEVKKDHVGCRILADRHYSRKTPGARLFTRPGYNQVLWHPDGAVFVWFRPKWEAGIERMDKLRAYECTLFRSESHTVLSSALILGAELMLLRWNRYDPTCNLMITGINTKKTRARRSKRAMGGACYIHAGWTKREGHHTALADLWLEKLVAPRGDG